MKEIKKLQNEILDTYKELRKIFKANNIEYFSLGGTAIGAFRHKGFIPWDDDMDLVIKYTDVDKLIDTINNHEFLSFKGVNIRDGQYLQFLKIYDLRKPVERFDIFDDRRLFIDIFIVYPEIKWNPLTWYYFKFQLFFHDAFSLSYKEHASYENTFIAIGYQILKGLFWFKKHKQFSLFNKTHKYIMRKVNKHDSQGKYMYLYHSVRDKEKFEISKILEIKFEDTHMPVIETFPDDARWVHGDIFKLPKNIPTNQHSIKIAKLTRDTSLPEKQGLMSKVKQKSKNMSS